jgi:hypothetical protein
MLLAAIGAVILVSAGTELVLMLSLQKSILGEYGPDVPREDDPARFERRFFFAAFFSALGAILLLIAFV